MPRRGMAFRRANPSASGTNLTLGTRRSVGQTARIDPLLLFEIGPMKAPSIRKQSLHAVEKSRIMRFSLQNLRLLRETDGDAGEKKPLCGNDFDIDKKPAL